MMKTLKLKAVFLGFLAVIMTGINFTSCNKQAQIPEIGENLTQLENQTLEQDIMSKEFIAYIIYFETRNSAPDYMIGKRAYGGLAMSAVGYRLDKQHPAATDFIQLIKDAQEANKPLRVTIEKGKSKRGQYITKVVKVSETEEKEWRESGKPNF